MYTDDCNSQLVQQDGLTTCYRLVFAGVTWSVAVLQCASIGPSSRLAIVTSAEQNDAIKDLLSKNGLTQSWLAASETVHSWQWLDGRHTFIPVSLVHLHDRIITVIKWYQVKERTWRTLVLL